MGAETYGVLTGMCLSIHATGGSDLKEIKHLGLRRGLLVQRSAPLPECVRCIIEHQAGGCLTKRHAHLLRMCKRTRSGAIANVASGDPSRRAARFPLDVVGGFLRCFAALGKTTIAVNRRRRRE